jgi:magnesium chelatase family protein
MSIAKSYSAQLSGLNSEIITIEVDISNGLHSFSIVGLGDRSIEEAKDRIGAAIKNSGFVSPKQKNQKVIISLAPADIRKEGPSFDLGMAMTYLLASQEIIYNPEDKIFLGELSLEGKVRKISGILPILSQIKLYGFNEVYIPIDNAKEASLAKNIKIYPVEFLSEIIDHFRGFKNLKLLDLNNKIKTPIINNYLNMNIVRGNNTAKRGLEIAAAGAHNVILYGPPGTGKTLLAQCFPSILPDLSYEDSIEVTGIHSISNYKQTGFIRRPPFRSPHHTASYPSIVGGGSFPKPGEVSLAHRGVLFLDEFPEFDKTVIEALRQPLEDGQITISRAKSIVTFPAQCILIASMNPCPCGNNKNRGCKCSIKSIEKYQSKISGPITDRIDIWLNVYKVDYRKLGESSNQEEDSCEIRNRVEQARRIQYERFKNNKLSKQFNSEMNASNIEKLINIKNEAKKLLIESSEKLNISGRGFHRILKVARTIADLEQSLEIKKEHILEAVQYRTKILI